MTTSIDAPAVAEAAAGAGGTTPGVTPPRVRGFRRPALRLRLWQLAAFVVVLLLWTLVRSLDLLSAQLLPSVGAVAGQVVDLVHDASFWTAVGTTVTGALEGLAIAVVVGIPLGLAIGMVPALDRATRLLIDLGRSFPVIALLPVMILIFGATQQMKVIVVLLGCLWPVLLQSSYGARRIEPVISQTVRSYRIPLRLRFTHVVLPSAAPYIATGLRIAASAALLITLGVEVISQTPGMGHELVDAQNDGASAQALAYLFFAGLLGVGFNALLSAVDDRLLRWHRRVEHQ